MSSSTGTGNRSHAVMAQRAEAHDSLDYFPTPPWAVRALVEHVLIGGGWRADQLSQCVAWEPACGEDHMVKALFEYFAEVIGTDVHDYGHEAVHDFLMPYLPKIVQARPGPHFIITNPPFRLAQPFIERALEVASQGVAMLVRSSFMEGVGRYREVFSSRPPLIIAPFAERVPMVKGRLDRSASSATSYAWFVWPGREFRRTDCATRVRWIPPCRKALEFDGDYDPPVWPVIPGGGP